MSIEIQVALIALGGVLFGSLLTFLTSVGAGVARIVRDAGERFRSARKLHEKYSDPLAHASLALMFRLRELVADGGRDYYLQTQEPRTSFETYKATSTLYRLAALLAWIQALRRELHFLRADRSQPRKHQRALESALETLSKALADGQHMEQLRVLVLAKQLDVQLSAEEVKRAGTNIDVLIDRSVHSHGKTSIGQLAEPQQRQLVDLVVAEILSMSAKGSSTTTQWRHTWAQIVPLLDAREAWIYRDWQAAIGDLLLVSAPEGPRAYDAIGYREFEELCTNGNDEQKKWIRRLSALVEDVDMSQLAHKDARPDVLRSAYQACGEIIVAINQLQGRRSPISSEQLKAARLAAIFVLPSHR